MKIRMARPSDVRRILLLKKDVILKINNKDYPKKTIVLLLKKNNSGNLLQKIKDKVVFCLFKKNILIGVISIDKNKIHGLAVRPSRTNKGYGKHLTKFVENHAKKKGVKKLTVYPSLTAQGFYEKLGFKKSGETSTWKFKDKILELNVPKMEKRIS